MTRFLLIFIGVLLVGSIGAFFLFVPPLLIATVALVLMGFALMFCLGVQVGARSLQSPGASGSPVSAQAEITSL
jgi:hypothetical protein